MYLDCISAVSRPQASIATTEPAADVSLVPSLVVFEKWTGKVKLDYTPGEGGGTAVEVNAACSLSPYP